MCTLDHYIRVHGLTKLPFPCPETKEKRVELAGRMGLVIFWFTNEQKCEQVCLAAVKQNGRALKYVNEQTPEICLTAVSTAGTALKYVHEQTPGICLTAVRNDGLALSHVKNQSFVICMAAMTQTRKAFKHIDNEDMLEKCIEILGGVSDAEACRYHECSRLRRLRRLRTSEHKAVVSAARSEYLESIRVINNYGNVLIMYHKAVEDMVKTAAAVVKAEISLKAARCGRTFLSPGIFGKDESSRYYRELEEMCKKSKDTYKLARRRHR